MGEIFRQALEWKIITAEFSDDVIVRVIYASKDPVASKMVEASKVYFSEIVEGIMTPKQFLIGLFGKENFISVYQVSIKSKHGLQNYPPFTTLWNINELVERELETHNECAVQIIKTRQYLEKDTTKKDVNRVNIPVQEG